MRRRVAQSAGLHWRIRGLALEYTFFWSRVRRPSTASPSEIRLRTNNNYLGSLASGIIIRESVREDSSTAWISPTRRAFESPGILLLPSRESTFLSAQSPSSSRYQRHLSAARRAPRNSPRAFCRPHPRQRIYLSVCVIQTASPSPASPQLNRTAPCLSSLNIMLSTSCSRERAKDGDSTRGNIFVVLSRYKRERDLHTQRFLSLKLYRLFVCWFFLVIQHSTRNIILGADNDEDSL